jgi:hypothetical protein
LHLIFNKPFNFLFFFCSSEKLTSPHLSHFAIELELQKLKDLYDMGFIMEEEYQRRRAEILGHSSAISQSHTSTNINSQRQFCFRECIFCLLYIILEDTEQENSNPSRRGSLSSSECECALSQPQPQPQPQQSSIQPSSTIIISSSVTPAVVQPETDHSLNISNAQRTFILFHSNSFWIQYSNP